MVAISTGEKAHRNGLRTKLSPRAQSRLPSFHISISTSFKKNKVPGSPTIGHSFSPMKTNQITVMSTK